MTLPAEPRVIRQEWVLWMNGRDKKSVLKRARRGAGTWMPRGPTSCDNDCDRTFQGAALVAL